MHSHDRTLLSSLGFADPDKRDRRHDWACQYLSQEQQALALAALVPHGWDDLTFRAARFEYPISKGSGPYKTTIGFEDLILTFNSSGYPRVTVDVEVKVHPVGVGEIIRQVGLYREFVPVSPGRFWIVATCFELTENDIDQLKRERITQVLLANRFEAFCQQQQGAPAMGKSPEI